MLQSDLFPAGDQDRTVSLAFAIGIQISARLADGCHLTRSDIAAMFASETGVHDWGNAWTIDDYNNAVEIGALLWLRDHARIDLNTNFNEAAARFDCLDAALPPRLVRSEGQVELQQFSTPPMLAWLITKAASFSPQDALLEPSAGNGALAIWAGASGCLLVLNEIDPARRDALSHIFPNAHVTPHDGEFIADLLRSPAPSVVLMNPPFARSAERGVSGRTAMRHLRSAFRVAAQRARIVAIMPEGFKAGAFAKEHDGLALRLDARLTDMFRKTGTGIPVRMVVFDKALDETELLSGDFSQLEALDGLLSNLPSRGARLPNVRRHTRS